MQLFTKLLVGFPFPWFRNQQVGLETVGAGCGWGRGAQTSGLPQANETNRWFFPAPSYKTNGSQAGTVHVVSTMPAVSRSLIRL